MCPDFLEGGLVEKTLVSGSDVVQFSLLLFLFLGAVPIADHAHGYHVSNVS